MTTPQATPTDPTPTGPTPTDRPAPGPAPRRRSATARREARTGWLWLQAWLIGFALFTAFPLVFSLYLSFTEWNGRGAPTWVGLSNFVTLFARDPLFWQSLKVTA
ncbi:MAG TPA: hypothetical protein VK020_02895, partial [Microlunatus sp.]|nr:hypothetical protein [Microlunatus sp.]